MDWSAVGWEGWAALGYATFLSLLVAYVIWNRSVQVVGPSRTVIYMCLTPLVAVATAAMFLGERPMPLQAVGAAFIIGGVLVTRGSAEPRSISSSLAMARRRWGITMLPPTTRPTEKISRNSSEETRPSISFVLLPSAPGS